MALEEYGTRKIPKETSELEKFFQKHNRKLCIIYGIFILIFLFIGLRAMFSGKYE